MWIMGIIERTTISLDYPRLQLCDIKPFFGASLSDRQVQFDRVLLIKLGVTFFLIHINKICSQMKSRHEKAAQGFVL